MSNQGYPQWIPLQNKTAFAGSYRELPRDDDGAEDSVYRKQTFKQKYFGGIKRTLRFFAFVAFIVLVTNIAWLVDAQQRYGMSNGFGTIQKGNCDAVKGLNTWLHLAINIFSTLLLTGSNAFMACFSCPSRKEVEKAHSRGKFLHVGSLSLRNLGSIAKRKGAVVLILALSSAPFHLLYNSLVFTSIPTNEYYWSVVTEDFLKGAPFNLTGDWGLKYATGLETIPTFSATPPNDDFGDTFDLDTSGWLNLSKVMNDYFGNIQSSAPSWERLENKDCIRAYSNVFLSTRRNVVLISSAKNDTNSILRYGSSDINSGSWDSNWWICSMEGQDGGFLVCNPETYVSSASTWEVWGYPVEYCLSEKVDDICSVNFSEDIMWVVIGFAALKVTMMIWVLIRYDAEQILASVGDAVASFLETEDQTTTMMCLANKREIRDFWQKKGMARPFTSHRRRWGSAVSKKRWALFILLMLFAFLLFAFFGVWGFIHLKDRGIGLDPASLWQLGFGKINQNAMVLYDNGSNVITMAVISNLPQLILSAVYLLFMGIMTSMFLAADWSNFAFKPQTLMVSSPSGKQRGTWLLGAPFGWGIALLVLSTLLHWFLSQSIFVVKMQTYNKDGSLSVWNPNIDFVNNSEINNCGYSAIPLILSVVASGVLLVTAMMFMLRRFPAGAPPVVSTCSTAISASCHPIHKYRGMLYGEFRWGANGGYVNGIGHCSLVPAEAWKDGHAQPPVDGWSYAGLISHVQDAHR